MASPNGIPAASGVDFHMPPQKIPAGTAYPLEDTTPTLFRPLHIRGKTLRNRICVTPMCQYACAPSGPQIGALTPLSIFTYFQYAFRGAALVMTEAVAVQEKARISVNCPGLWNDTQQDGMKTLAELIHSQGGLFGVQLSHAGRKGSTVAPWIAAERGKSSAIASAADEGWPDEVLGPSGGSDQTWDGKSPSDPSGGYCEPHEMSEAEIVAVVDAMGDAASRAVKAGVDVIEIHAAHGYLVHQFLSPVTNRRRDKYGGSFENNTRILIDMIKAVRAAVPADTPVFVRLSATDWMEETELGKKYGSWDVPSSIRLAKMLPELGVDLLDITSGGLAPEAAFTLFEAGFRNARNAAQIRNEVLATGQALLFGTVGQVTDAKQARDLVQENPKGRGESSVDIVSMGRQFLRQPGWVLTAAHELGVNVAWPVQLLKAAL